MDGLFNIYKEAGMTSHDVVAKVRRILNTKTVGHTGTLDPEATGVLVVAVGRGTKVIEYMEQDEKIYEAKLTLGIITDTEDIWGKVLEKREVVNVDEVKIKEVLKSFIGKQQQVPPMYSALKVNGKKLYELARLGEVIERKARDIKIFDIYNVKVENDNICFTVHCSKGTYIRTLCKDIGEKLGCGAVMSGLKRICSGKFSIEGSIKLEDLEKVPEKYLINPEIVLEKFPIISLEGVDAEKYINGVKIFSDKIDGKYRMYINNTLYGVCKVENNVIKSDKKIS